MTRNAEMESATGNLMVTQFISLDGVVETPERWMFPFFDDALRARLFPQGNGEARLRLIDEKRGEVRRGLAVRCPG